MYHITKNYYPNNCSNKCSHESNDNMSNPFFNQANLLLSLYYKHDIKAFNCNYIKFNKLLIQYPNYKYNSSQKIIVKLLQIVNILYNLDVDLKEQLNFCENDMIHLYDRNIGVECQKLDIVQNTSIDLAYLQYLLLYDIEETNGLFIESNLIIARQVLADNNGKLKHICNDD